MRFIWICLLLLFFEGISAQETKRVKNVHYGAIAAYESTLLGWTSPINPTQIYPVAWSEKSRKCFAFGFFMEYPLSNSISFRPQLQGSFSENKINFKSSDQTTESQQYKFSDIELPIHIVLTNRKGQFPLKGCIIFGGRLGWNLSQKKEEQYITFYRERFGLDLGLGVEMKVKKLRFQPEVIYSFGTNNVNDATKTYSTWSIGKAIRDKMAIRTVFYF